MIQQCPECVKESRTPTEPLKPSPLPDYPWQIAGSDLFELKGEQYLLVVDYYSRYPEVVKLKTTTSSAIIGALKAVFSRHGLPEVLRSDNGPQYSSREFEEFAKSYSFHHVTSSPRYPQSNGQAERTVQTVKHLLKQSTDQYMALLNYRTTPLPWCGLSPAELSMGRPLRTLLPQTDNQLHPKWPYLSLFRQKDQQQRDRQKKYFDSRHRVSNLPDIPDGSEVWIRTEGGPVEGTVLSPAERPRSYVIDTPAGRVEKNRRDLKEKPPPPLPELEDSSPIPSSPPTDPTTEQPRITTRSQTGIALAPPDRLNITW